MQPETGLPGIVHAIQLAVAPVFLFSGIGALLAVLTNRLGRIVDRARQLEAELPGLSESTREPVSTELATLLSRSKLINRAIWLVTSSALLICFVITVLFVAAFTGVDASTAVGVTFIVAMLGLIGGLVYFLSEVGVATQSLRIGMPPERRKRDGKER